LKILVIHASDVAIKGIQFGIAQPKMLRVKKLMKKLYRVRKMMEKR